MKKERQKLVEAARAALERLEVERAQMRERHREEAAEFTSEARVLRATIRMLEGKQSRKVRAASQAGPKALGAVRSILATGPCSQAQITRETGISDGTISYAMRALVEAGEIEPTGKRVNGSREFRLRRSRRRAA